jgi:hypothetical protein
VAEVLDVFRRIDAGEDLKFLRLTIFLSKDLEYLARL